jgi:response regulator RpfG family c-di-GMP phosphodiesterase
MIPKILFVDDEPNVLRGLARLLTTYEDEFDVEFAESFDTAMLKLMSGDFDAVFTDFNMPGKDGIELIETMNSMEYTRDIPVVMLTGNGEANLKRRALEAGAADLLQKPADEADLVARVRSVLSLKRTRDALRRHVEDLEVAVWRRTRELELSRFELVLRLSKAAELHDQETGEHTLRVGIISACIGEAMGLSKERLNALVLAAPLHDIGKIGISDRILQKPGILTPEERAMMQKHCELGHGILTETVSIPASLREYVPFGDSLECPFMKDAAEIALEHHERFDGLGYPYGKKGDQISLNARIVAVADVFDALRSERPYKKAFSLQRTLEIIRAERGKHFDPMVIDAFEQSLPNIVLLYPPEEAEEPLAA